jgi:hypothetical protein
MLSKLPPPDLSHPAGRANYQAELQRVAFGPRFLGLAALMLGALLEIAPLVVRADFVGGYRIDKLGWACLIGGWALLLATVLFRSVYHHWRTSQR